VTAALAWRRRCVSGDFAPGELRRGSNVFFYSMNNPDGTLAVGRAMEVAMLGTILLVLLILMLLGAVPAWPYSRSWGYAPSGVVLLLLVVIVVAVTTGHI
jgi:hypothetical protein